MSTPAALDICGLNEGGVAGFAPITPEQAIDAALCIREHALSLDDQKMLTLMVGLDASPVQAPAPREARPAVKPDMYRRGRRRGK